MRKWRLTAAALFGLLAAGPLSFAHHSFLAEFDQNKPMSVTGVVTKVTWINPHTYFSVAVTDQNGKVVNWLFETASPSALEMRGWQRNSLKVGDKITVQGYRTKKDSNLAAARLVFLPDGRRIFSGTMDDGGPDQ